ncbi:MAG: 2-isopropylmalate synthase [Thermoguttaceae bacterium]|nr:2-isopropylmalate synthase [Planctomycetaceae bacterium]MBQ4143579.1 2-isopropylmalate synthase [Thermoguttaceae bacterium]
MSDRKIVIFDTTLRDGEQSPGASMNIPEKLEVAQMLSALGVDVIEAGFPVVSPGDFESVQKIAGVVKGSSVCALARCKDRDIEAAWEAIKGAERPRIHVFLATSPIHREYKLRMTKEQVLENTAHFVKKAVSLCPDIEFSAEDASRTEIDFLCEVVEVAIRAGAKTVNIPDTVGYAIPNQFAEYIRALKTNVPNIEEAVISVHCHNDLGLAMANSMAAVEAGAGQVECTINGLGERAGNCALEEVVMALKTRHEYFKAYTDVVTRRLVPASCLVSGITGLDVPRNKAIVGRNAFAHESGIHQDGMLKNSMTYEIMRPEDVGFQKTDLVLGKHSGRAALNDKVTTLGYSLDQDQLNKLFEEFKVLTDRKKEIYDADIRALVQQILLKEVTNVSWTLESYSSTSATGKKPTTSIKLRRGDFVVETQSEMTTGDGPVDGIFLAICKLTGLELKCREYRVHSVSVGHDAQGKVDVMIEFNGQEFRGQATSTDCIEASIMAFLDAVNRIAA